MNNTTKDKKKWGGLGNILHKDRPTSTTDSTYGSEGSRESYNSATAPTPSLTGSDTSRNTVDNQGNQVVTTTTTTTTTTTSGAGGSSTTSGPHGSNLMNKLDPRVDSSSDQTEVSEVRRENAPGIPARNQMRERSPNPPVQSSRAQEYGSPTTSGSNNFSYPGRAGPAGGSGGTLEGLKQAAVGIHGAGETLRGTLNSAVDRRMGGSAEQVAAHERVANSGRAEIQSGQLSDHSRAQGGVGNPVKGILRKREGSGGLRVVNE